MIKISDLKNKDVINLYNGVRMGYIYDFEVDIERGALIGIVIPGEGSRVLNLFSKTNDIVIHWNKIIKIGPDAILVDIKDE